MEYDLITIPGTTLDDQRPSPVQCPVQSGSGRTITVQFELRTKTKTFSC